MRTRQQEWQTARIILGVAAITSGFALAAPGCAGRPSDRLCRPAVPKDELVYRAEILQARADKERAYRTGDDSPVPLALRPQLQLSFYPIDIRMRLIGPLIRDARADTFTIVATSGKRRPIRTIGHFELDLGAQVETLSVYQLLDLDAESAGHLFVPFMDATSVVETYPAGRYVEVEEVESGRYVLDFNLAYNPLCAYGGTFNCPITPRENRLRSAVRAGEKGYHQEAGEVPAASATPGAPAPGS
jgi:uncharacterized protein (DUF1684 family)